MVSKFRLQIVYTPAHRFYHLHTPHIIYIIQEKYKGLYFVDKDPDGDTCVHAHIHIYIYAHAYMRVTKTHMHT